MASLLARRQTVHHHHGLPPSLVAHTIAGSTVSPFSTVTTATITTTGATLLVAAVACDEADTITLTDSKSNTWLPLINENEGAVGIYGQLQMFYCSGTAPGTPPVTGSGHTFTATTLTSGNPVIAVQAWSGTTIGAVSDVNVGNVGAVNGTEAPGSATPAQNAELILTAVTYGDTSTLSVGSGFAISDQLPTSSLSGGINGIAMASLVQGTAAAVNPSWTWPSSTEPGISVMVSFGTSTTARPPGNLYWGAWISTQFNVNSPPYDYVSGTNSSPSITDFATTDCGGKYPSVLQWGNNWSAGVFPTTQMANTRSMGLIPCLTWTTDNFTLAQIISGSADSFLTSWATGAASWGYPFFLRMNPEMNGSWETYGVGNGTNTAAQVQQSWQHVHNIVAPIATQATWLWCPNVIEGVPGVSFASIWPGSAYVDWTGFDGYNTDSPWTTFETLFAASYADTLALSGASSLPMMIGETACTETGGSKASWITAMFSSLPVNFPNIKGFLWFEYPGVAGDDPIESSTTSEAAFAAGIAAANYKSNIYGSLASGKVPAP